MGHHDEPILITLGGYQIGEAERIGTTRGKERLGNASFYEPFDFCTAPRLDFRGRATS